MDLQSRRLDKPGNKLLVGKNKQKEHLIPFVSQLVVASKNSKDPCMTPFNSCLLGIFIKDDK